MNLKAIAGIVAASFFLPGSPRAQSANSISSRPEAGRKDAYLSFPGSPLGIAWGFLYGNLGVKAEQFMAQVRELGGGFTKVYLFWDQVEPQKGNYDWSAVDAFINQLKAPEEGLISLFSSSQWAVKRPAALLPPSPARNPDDYYRFVNELVKHCHGCVRYWQNDSEPNNPIYWSGTKEEFVAQLKVFHKAVKDADSSAVATADAFQRMAKALAGVRAVKRIDVPGRPSIFLFEVDRGARGPVFVVWERRDEFTGENSPAVPFDYEWAGTKATAMDALGQTVPTHIADRRLHLEISLTPVFLEPVR